MTTLPTCAVAVCSWQRSHNVESAVQLVFYLLPCASSIFHSIRAQMGQGSSPALPEYGNSGGMPPEEHNRPVHHRFDGYFPVVGFAVGTRHTTQAALHPTANLGLSKHSMLVRVFSSCIAVFVLSSAIHVTTLPDQFFSLLVALLLRSVSEGRTGVFLPYESYERYAIPFYTIIQLVKALSFPSMYFIAFAHLRYPSRILPLSFMRTLYSR